MTLPFSSFYCGDESTNPPELSRFWTEPVTSLDPITNSAEKTSGISTIIFPTAHEIDGPYASVSPRPLSTASPTIITTTIFSTPINHDEATGGLKSALRGAYIAAGLLSFFLLLLLGFVVYLFFLLPRNSRPFIPKPERPEIAEIMSKLRKEGPDRPVQYVGHGKE